jgi:hypothetical protein
VPRKFHQEAHFKMNELILYYNFPVLTDEMKEIRECHHIENLRCSRAVELTPDDCKNVRKCELYTNRKKLFFPLGIDLINLQHLDNELRQSK